MESAAVTASSVSSNNSPQPSTPVLSASPPVSASVSAASLPQQQQQQQTATIQVQALPLHQYFPNVNDTTTMQFYAAAAAAHSVSVPDASQQHSGVQVQVPVQVQVQPQYLNPAIAYQQWFQQQLAQQQQAQQNQSVQQQDSVQFPSVVNADGTQIFATPYLDHNQNLDFHSLSSNGQVVSSDGALSISTLQSFANSLQQVQHGQGQTFMLSAPSSNNGSYVTVSNALASSADHHGQSQQQPQQQQQLNQAAAPPKKKAGRQPKAAAVAPLQPEGKVKPPKPKGTPNAYALFYKETYAKLRSENPEWKASQIMAEAGKIWKVMNGSIQDRYRSQAEAMVQAQAALNCNSKAGHKKQKNAVKRPMTAYQLFIREHFSTRPAEVAQMHAKDFLLRLSVQWKNLDEADKKNYQDRAKLLKSTREAEAEAAAIAALAVPVNGSNGSVVPQPEVKVELEQMEIQQQMVPQQSVAPTMVQYYHEETYSEVKKGDNWDFPLLPQWACGGARCYSNADLVLALRRFFDREELKDAIQNACKDCDASTILDLISAYKPQLGNGASDKTTNAGVARPKAAWYLGKRSMKMPGVPSQAAPEGSVSDVNVSKRLVKSSMICANTQTLATLRCLYLYKRLLSSEYKSHQVQTTQRKFGRVPWYLG